MSKRNVLHSPRLSELRRKQKKVFLLKILVYLILSVIVVTSLSYLSRIDKLNISLVEVTGNKVVDQEALQAVAERELSGYYLWVFPKTNIFFYPKSPLKNVFHKEFKRLKNIELSVRNREVLEVTVTERIPKYTWCGDSLPEQNTNKEICYFLDETGYIFDEAPYFSGEVYFKFYGKVDGALDIPSGYYFFKPYFNKLVLFKEVLDDMNLKTASAYLQNDGEVKIILSPASRTSTIPEILCRIDSDLEAIAENLQTALTTEPLQANFKNKYSSLLYIDLRFGNKVYYKFK